MKDAAPATLARPLWSRSFLRRIAVGSLLSTYAVLALAASLHKGPAFDEPAQLVAGYNNWQEHDFRLMAANGDFLKRWTTLPFLITKPNIVPVGSLEYHDGLAHPLGFLFFFQAGNSPELLLLQSRLMVLILGVALGLLIYICACEISGWIGGITALIIYCFSPSMLAFGAMVSPDIPLALALLGSTWSLWRLLHRVTWSRLLGSLVFLAMLALSRPSAIVIVPIALILFLLSLLNHQPLEWSIGRPRLVSSRTGQTAVFAGLLLVHGFAAWGAVWTNYDFRYIASPPTIPNVETANPTGTFHILPQGYVDGIQASLANQDTRKTFLDSAWNLTGWPHFLLSTAWQKNSPVLYFIVALGLCGGCAHLATIWPKRRSPVFSPPQDDAIHYYAIIPYVVLAVVYFLMIASSVKLGLRMTSPVLPALAILSGLGAAWVWNLRARWVRSLLVFLLVWRAGEALIIYPDYLAYFNPFVGGPAEGYQHLVDKSLDWGMDLPSLKLWLEQKNPKNSEPVYLAYFGTDDPAHYGIQCQRLPGYPEWSPRDRFALSAGYYAISATLFQTLYTQKVGPWNKEFENRYQTCLREMEKFDDTANYPAARAVLLAQYPPAYWDQLYTEYEQLRFARLCSWLRHHISPQAYAGYSILIWRLDATQLRSALTSVPAELADAPL